MKTKDDIKKLEKTIGQLRAIHCEISLLSKKSPTDAVNSFKLTMINKIIEMANHVLGETYKPIDDFEKFDDDDVPSTSDVVFVVAQYIKEAERLRDNHIMPQRGKWVYLLNGEPSDIFAESKL